MWSEVFPIYSDNKIIQRKLFSLFFVSGMMDASLVMLLTSSTNSFQNTTQLAAASNAISLVLLLSLNLLCSVRSLCSAVNEN